MSKRKNTENEMTIWKFGCNWGGRQNPNFYEFIETEKIVIGREHFKYAEGDLVLITVGFTVKAIVKVLEEPQPITVNPNYFVLSENYNVTWDNQTIFAKAEWYELPEAAIFQYLSQRGSGKVRKLEIKEIAIELWNNRNR
jgi:hypothetical protein